MVVLFHARRDYIIREIEDVVNRVLAVNGDLGHATLAQSLEHAALAEQHIPLRPRHLREDRGMPKEWG